MNRLIRAEDLPAEEIDAPEDYRPGHIRLRPSAGEDKGFLYQVYAVCRQEELSGLGWPPDQMEAFLQMQFSLQDRQIRENYSGIQLDIVVVDGGDAGRFYTAWSSSDVCIVDIALLPQYRNRGVGTCLLQQILDQAGASGRRVCLHAAADNTAQSLYQRLGFCMTEDLGVYRKWEWRPGPAV